MTAPIVEMQNGIAVVRDDLFPGGTKARFVGSVFDHADEAVYASPPEGARRRRSRRSPGASASGPRSSSPPAHGPIPERWKQRALGQRSWRSARAISPSSRRGQRNTAGTRART